MGIPVLIIGKSGSGKTSALKNFGADEIGFINVSRKPLPYKGKGFVSTMLTDSYVAIEKALKKTEKKSIVIDDAGYLLTNMFMKGHAKTGSGNAIFAFFNTIADNFWTLIESIKDLPEDKIIYVIMHEQKNEFGDIAPKTIGKLLDDKVCIEGMFTIALRSVFDTKKFYFKTKTNGLDVTKTPFEMFDDELIPNDLKMVDVAIRNFYEI